MDLLISLGVNETLVIQFGIFIVAYATLKYLLFQPYFEAYNERSERTVGKAELAERFVAETKALEERYTQAAQEANQLFREVYDKSRAEAVKEYDQIVAETRARTRHQIDEAQIKIKTEMEAARTQLAKEVSGVTQLINQKLIGKDLAV